MKYVTRILIALVVLAMLASCAPNGAPSPTGSPPAAPGSAAAPTSEPPPSTAPTQSPPAPPEGTASDEAGASPSAAPDEPNYSLDESGRFTNPDAEFGMRYFPFVADSETMQWHYDNVIGPNSCVDGYLYIKDMASGHIRLAYPEPVGDLWTVDDTLFVVIDDGRSILQLSESARYEPFLLLENAGEDILEIVDDDGFLYYCDAAGAHRIPLDKPAKETLVSADDVAYLNPCDGLLLTYHSGRAGVHTYDDETVTLRLTNPATGFSREIPYEWEHRALSRGSAVSPAPPHTTELADSLGIDVNDFPVLDGSADAYPILESIYWELFRPDSTLFDKNYPAAPSGTDAAYARLISGDADLIIAPYASDDILRSAENAAAPLEFCELATAPSGERLYAVLLVDLPADHPARVLYDRLVASPQIVEHAGFVPYPHTTELADSLGISHSNYPKIDGSTSTYGLVSSIYWEMFNLDSALFGKNYPADPSKTVPSYRKLIAGEVDMIFVPYASADVLREAADAGVELEFYKVAAEALVFVTPEENPTENITREQTRSIYLDYGIKNWSELGGPDRELVPICRNADSGSQSQMDNLILDGEPMHPDIQDNYVELTMEGMLQLTAAYHNGGMRGEPTNSYALGYTLYSYLLEETERTGIGDSLKILSYEGIAPSAENIADGSYPLADGYYAVLRRDLPADHPARTILDWMLRDTTAVEEAGLIPVNETRPSGAASFEYTLDALPLTDEQLDFFNTEFFNSTDLDGRVALFPNQFLTSEYASPDDIDLFGLFYNGFAADLTDEELAFCERNGFWMELDIQRTTAEEMTSTILEYTGETMAFSYRRGIDMFLYNPDTDAYYLNHSDTNYMSVEFTHGWCYPDGRITLRYDGGYHHDGAEMELTLQRHENTYHIKSNLTA